VKRIFSSGMGSEAARLELNGHAGVGQCDSATLCAAVNGLAGH
jgi:uncharacterized protein YsxB (DUF464 family)